MAPIAFPLGPTAADAAAARARLDVIRNRLRADPSMTINDIASAEYWRDAEILQARRWIDDQLALDQAVRDLFRGTDVLYYGRVA
jgi:hypothetical protein